MGLFRKLPFFKKKNHTPLSFHINKKIYYPSFYAKIKSYIPSVQVSFKRSQFWKEPKYIAFVASGLFIALLGGIIFRNQISTFFSSVGADPIAYWRFDEGQGSTTNDAVGNNTGTLGTGNSAPVWQFSDQCISEKCFFFDGTNDYITLGSPSTLDNLPSSNFTISAWIYDSHTGTDTWGTIFGTYLNSIGWSLRTFSDSTTGARSLYFQAPTSGTDHNAQTYYGSIPQNKWTHVAAVWNASSRTVKLYINGQEPSYITYSTPSGTYSSDATRDKYIGLLPHNGGIQPFKGRIDDVKVHTYALTTAQIKAELAARGTVHGLTARFGDDDMNRRLSDGLVGYWKMGESANDSCSGGQDVCDSSGNGNHATATGTTISSTEAKYNSFGRDFSGSFNNFVAIPDNATFTGGDEMTVSLWIKPDTIDDFDVYVSQGDRTFNHAAFMLNSTSGGDQLRVDISSNGTDYSNWVSNASLSLNTWTHITVTFNRGIVKIYFNGQLDSAHTEAPFSDSIYNSNQPILLGRRTAYASERLFDGTMNELRIYNRALDPLEVQALYEWAPGPIHEYNFNSVSGTTVLDEGSSSKINGTLTSGAVITNGKYGKGVLFNGEDSYIDFDSNELYQETNAFSITSWIYIASFSSDPVIICDQNDSGSCFFASANWRSVTNALHYCGDSECSDGSYNGNSISNVIKLNQWQHVAMSYNGTNTCRFYVDGVDVTSDATCGETSEVYSHRIGGGSLNVTNGSLDEVKIYDYELSTVQVIQDMNAGHPAPGSPVGSAIAYYKLDEGYGTTVYNSGNAGSTLNGTFGTGTSSPTWSNSGKYDKGVLFDGSNDAIVIQDNQALQFGTGNFSVSAWIYPTVTDLGCCDQSTIISKNYTGFEYIIHQGFLRAYLGGATAVISGTQPLSSNRWYHVLLTRSGSTVTSYINGEVDSVGVSSSSVSNIGTNVNIGQRTGNALMAFNGIIDEVKIYNFAFTADQAKVEFNQGNAIVLGAGSTDVGGTSPSNSASREYCVPGDTSFCAAPVGEWKFDRQIGDTTPDTSTNGNQGSLHNGPVQVKGKVGRAFSFDGDNDYINIGDQLEEDLPVTVSSWVKPRSLSETFAIFTNDKTNSTHSGIWFEINSNGSVGINYGDNTGTSSSDRRTKTSPSGLISTGQWYHVTAVLRDATDMNIYVNGVDVGGNYSGSGGTLAYSTRHARIGQLHDDIFANGLIDDVRMYNYARTPAQIAWEYNQGGPIAYYPLNECSGTTVYNHSKNGNGDYISMNGTINLGSGGTTSAGTCTTSGAWKDGASGKLEASMYFDNSDDYISISDNDILNFPNGTDFSIGAWVKVSSLGDNNAVVSKKLGNGDAQSGYMMYVNSAGKIAAYLSDGTDAINKFTDSTITAGTWYYITLVYRDNTSLTLYINGKDGGGSVSGTIANIDSLASGTGLAIGGESDGGLPFGGQIDEVKIFNYALTPAQIKTEMVGGAVRFE